MATKNLVVNGYKFVIGEDGKLRPDKANLKNISNITDTTKEVARDMYAEKSAEMGKTL